MHNIVDTLLLNKLIFSVNSSYFLDKPTLTATYIIIFSNRFKLGLANFILSAALSYRNTYTAELCRASSIIKLLKYIILSNNIPLNYERIIVIYSDYSAMIQFLYILLVFIPFTSPIYQIKNEIIQLKEKLQIYLSLIKVKAYQDERVSQNRLTFAEKVNIICDL